MTSHGESWRLPSGARSSQADSYAPKVAAPRRTLAIRWASGFMDTLQGAGRLWPFWLMLGVSLAVATLGLATGFERLGERWAFAYKHGYLLLGMSGWLLLRALPDVAISRLAPSLTGLFVLLAGTLVYGLAELLDFTLGMQAMLPILLFALIVALGGRQLIPLILLPIALLYFAIPVWDLLVAPLQAISTGVVTGVLGMGGFPVYVEGNLVYVAGGAFEIAEGCSGDRYFIVALALAAFYGFDNLWKSSNRWLLLAAAGVAAAVSNWIRIYILIRIGEATAMQHPLIADHDAFGWVVFGIMMAPVLLIARWLQTREGPWPAAVARVPGSIQRASAMAFLLTGAAAALILLGPAALRSDVSPPEVPARIGLGAAAPAGWSELDTAGGWRPQFLRPHVETQASFARSAAAEVDVYLVRYQGAGGDSKLISRRNSLSSDWNVAATRGVTAEMGGSTVRLHEMELTAGGERRVVWSWYIIGGVATHDQIRAKLLEVPAALRGRREGAQLAVSSTCDLGCEGARELLRQYLAGAGESLDALARAPMPAGAGR
ncbi:MAG: EpsI family protein [Gammaproteobacteria bacterium]|nr:EpsI family protein [Gammaproteobacteria bacterium]